jgi:RNA polymerase sigma-70 factor (ECF subfamily)
VDGGGTAIIDAVEPSSGELVGRVQAGDREALDRLCARYLPRLRRIARGRLPRHARERLDTDDLVQETLVRSLDRLRSFEPRFDGALLAYLRQAVLNRVRDEVRRAGGRPATVEATGAEADPGPSPLDDVIGQETVSCYEAALARLSPDQREAVVGRIEMGLPFAELADALGKPSADAARMAVSRALLRLAEEMADGR